MDSDRQLATSFQVDSLRCANVRNIGEDPPRKRVLDAFRPVLPSAEYQLVHLQPVSGIHRPPSCQPRLYRPFPFRPCTLIHAGRL